jgi:hypothetical protein
VPKVLQGLKFMLVLPRSKRHTPEVAVNKPAIFSLGAMACVVAVLAVPSYNNLQKNTAVQPDTETNHPVSGKHWQCVTQQGPDAPNLIVLRDNGGFLKLIDYSEISNNGTNYDLRGSFQVEQDRLLAHVRKPDGEIVTDAYTVKPLGEGKMRMTQATSNTESKDTEDTLYSCRMLASSS